MSVIRTNRSARGLFAVLVAMVLAAGLSVFLGGTASAADYRPMRNANSGQCADNPGSSGQSGQEIKQYRCNGGANQSWSLQFFKQDSANGDVYRIENGASHLCMKVDHDSQNAGTPIVQKPCNNDANGLWHRLRVESSGGGYLFYTYYSPGYCLSVEGASQREGAKLVQLPCREQANQIWR